MRRRGLTLIEVAVVLFILVMLIGYFLPARSRVCRVSDRTHTNNNLKQCAFAVHNYHDTYRRLPDGMNIVGRQHDKTEMSLWFHLLPYVEADNVYKAANGTAVVPAFNAPADPFNVNEEGIVNFAANVRLFGYITIGADSVNKPGEAIEVPAGTMKANLTMKEIADGTSNTIMLTTRYSTCGDMRTYYAADAHGKSNIPLPAAPGMGGFMGAGSHSTPPTKTGPLSAMFQLAPSVKECLPNPGVFGHSFGSRGMSVALLDASIKHIAPTMTPTTFARALCPGDQNKLGEDWRED